MKGPRVGLFFTLTPVVIEDLYEIDQQVTDITMRLHICRIIGNYLDSCRNGSMEVVPDLEEKARVFCVKLTAAALRRAPLFIDTPSLPWNLLKNRDATDFEKSECLCLVFF